MLPVPIARDLGVSTPTVFAAFCAALIVAAFLGPHAGRAIDRWGGRPVLTATSVVFAIGLGDSAWRGTIRSSRASRSLPELQAPWIGPFRRSSKQRLGGVVPASPQSHGRVHAKHAEKTVRTALPAARMARLRAPDTHLAGTFIAPRAL